jgi:hypothetical protein
MPTRLLTDSPSAEMRAFAAHLDRIVWPSPKIVRNSLRQIGKTLRLTALLVDATNDHVIDGVIQDFNADDPPDAASSVVFQKFALFL